MQPVGALENSASVLAQSYKICLHDSLTFCIDDGIILVVRHTDRSEENNTKHYMLRTLCRKKIMARHHIVNEMIWLRFNAYIPTSFFACGARETVSQRVEVFII